jgi:hypothetical protein
MAVRPPGLVAEEFFDEFIASKVAAGVKISEIVRVKAKHYKTITSNL